MLYMWEITMIWTCFSRFPNDHILLKATIWALLAVDTVGVAATNATAYLYVVTHWGDLVGISKEYWSYPLYCVATAFSALIVQSFLIFRFWNLSKNHILTALIWCISWAAWVAGIYTSALLVKFPFLTQRDKFVTPVAVWFGCSTACDLAITLSLVWQLRKVKTPFASTQTLISRLTNMAIRTGCVTSFFALLILALYAQDPAGSIAVAFNSCFGRIYALTMMYNLNTRDSIRRAGASRSGGTSGQNVTNGNAAIDLSNIRVDTQVVSDYGRPSKNGPTYYPDQNTIGDDRSFGSERTAKAV
ncbi:hypothetical protein PUNSTDRAFT_130461 [Punctularia strigosozonata HHB-11173 SS5]|uniref:uncharacterized protein n=1 Tax=Punctularia strigosozonata (strain HHB-11173) TaxID=741275 RepID=UPI000441711B|nr:uncharacterized protein PUNSTDRAFT_130461 [Punctularia strigosozonata HHB-11173 SS5]EIN12192.1 hypothetical protein PUNSTDRAFT_130461 [Punctularia strigosozonata HHB-11173 SS5]